jgi:hypothetical protein
VGYIYIILTGKRGFIYVWNITGQSGLISLI